jgi:hypothetical protein
MDWMTQIPPSAQPPRYVMPENFVFVQHDDPYPNFAAIATDASPITSVQKLPGCLENKAEWECVDSNATKIRSLHGWVLCGYTVRDPLTWEPILVLCDACCHKRGYRW